ncbi:MAG: hypothetical protein WD749_13565 [Phycisphaerales bacterium]
MPKEASPPPLSTAPERIVPPVPMGSKRWSGETCVQQRMSWASQPVWWPCRA